MKNYISNITLLLLLVILGTSCTKKFDEINTNPDRATKANAAWLATDMITSITSSNIGRSKGFCRPFMLSKYVLWTESQEDIQYNDIGRISFSRLAVLRNIPIMNQYAQSKPQKVQNSYRALGHFIRAWQFYQLTMKVGDIPYSQAIKGKSEGILKPKYDTQKQVFLGILSELDSANYLFSKGATFEGDFIYDGNPKQWQRLVNSFELQVLMQLYLKTGDPDLDVINRFKDIVTNRPIMRDYKDNFAVEYKNVAGYAYPWSNTATQINSFVIYPVIGAALITPLKTLKDRRLFYYAEPAPSKINAGLSPSDWDAYIPVKASLPIGQILTAHSEGKYCDFNNRYKDLYNAEPVGLLNYWDVQFLIAEAAVRGWLPGNLAQQHYEAGIKGSMLFLENHTPEKYNHGMPLTSTYIQTYISRVALTGNKENKIKQIITQKYLANFLQDYDYTAWFAHRRTGYPEFILNPNTNLNTPKTKFPIRWLYPQDELEYNSKNVSAAIERQYGNNNTTNGKMWILKN